MIFGRLFDRVLIELEVITRVSASWGDLLENDWTWGSAQSWVIFGLCRCCGIVRRLEWSRRSSFSDSVTPFDCRGEVFCGEWSLSWWIKWWDRFVGTASRRDGRGAGVGLIVDVVREAWAACWGVSNESWEFACPSGSPRWRPIRSVTLILW